MKRYRFVLAAVMVLAASLAAVDACMIVDPRPYPPWPRPRPTPPPRLDPMQTRLHTAAVSIHDAAASVNVKAVFYNPNGTRVEGTYFFPIEPDAVVRDFSMTVNGKTLEAELLDADKARETYEDIVRKQKDPALLEYVGTRMLKARVYPIEPHAEVTIALSYTQVVRVDGGLYHFRYPLRSARPGNGQVGKLAFKVSVKAAAPVKLFYSPSHEMDVRRKGDYRASGGFELQDVVPERDVDVYWSLDASDIGVAVAAYQPEGEDGYCMLSITPGVERDAADVQPKDVVFVFDKSGSMTGDKIRQARKALVYCLRHLNREDRFAVIAFSTDADDLTDGLVKAAPQAVARAVKRVEAMEARGGTAIRDALDEGFALLKPTRDRLAMMVFLTDGRPTVGETDVQAILAAARKANKGDVRLFVFGVGYDLNTELLDRLALDGNGTQQYVSEEEDIETKVSGFYDKIAAPVLSDVRILVDGVKLRDLYPRRMPDVFAGGQVLVFGRYRGRGRHTLVVRGRAGGEERAFECRADFDGSKRNRFLPPLWAHRKVAFLLEEMRLHGHDRELEREIVALGKRFGIMTPYTSFLVAEDESPATQTRLRSLRNDMEQSRSGRAAVGFSRELAEGKAMDMAAPASAPPMLGFGLAGRGTGYGVSGFTAAAEPVERLAREGMRKIADRVFYLDADGFYVDSAFDESMQERIVEVESFSDAYFELLRKHPDAGHYLAEGLNLVLVLDGTPYRIAGGE